MSARVENAAKPLPPVPIADRRRSPYRRLLYALFPFLSWFPMSRASVRADILAGITLTLILVPQSMAYAQLAGLPVIYGLYAASIPVIVASLWGSLRQLHTGPTAMLSLMSAAAVVPFASAGSDQFIAISVMLALMVGILRLALGLFRLGIIINLLSHPVTIGFTNAAALIIGLSQLNKLLNVPMPRSDFFLSDVWGVITQLPNTHWPTVAFAAATFAIILGLQKWRPRAPAVLIAIVVTTAVSYLITFGETVRVPLAAIDPPEVRADLLHLVQLEERIKNTRLTVTERQHELEEMRNVQGQAIFRKLELEASFKHEQVLWELLEQEKAKLRDRLQQFAFVEIRTAEGTRYVMIPPANRDALSRDARIWRFNGFSKSKAGRIKLSTGGEVVGSVPAGLPSFQAPRVEWSLVLTLLPAALVMALLGFMEATSISTAIAAKTKQRVNTNKELIGQGLANVVGSFFQSYTVSGSFSRSAVAAREGAQTGLAAITSAIGVMLVILFLTPLLFHLPQATLAVIIMLAVFGLIRFKALIQAWRVDKQDATIGIVTFFATLLVAPSLANGILIGVGLTILVYLLRKMRPRMEILGRHPDGTLGGMDTYGLPPLSDRCIVLRFDGSLNFVNVAYFEQGVLNALARFPNAKGMLIIGSGINSIDVSGMEKIAMLADQLRAAGIEMCFSSLKRQVMKVFESERLREAVPPDHIFKTKEHALAALANRFHMDGATIECHSGEAQEVKPSNA